MSLAARVCSFCARTRGSFVQLRAFREVRKYAELPRGGLNGLSPARFYYRPRALEPEKTAKPLPVRELPSYEIFSPAICKFIAQRSFENKNSGNMAWVTSFTDEDPLGIVELNDFVFGANPRIDILHRVVVWQRAKKRSGTASVKTKAEVRGGGRKPWRQKGMNKARQGSIRAPHFRGGGVVHGPKPKSYDYNLPKKVRRMGLRVALSVRYAQGDLHIVDSFEDIESDKDLIPILDRRGWTSAVLVDSKRNFLLFDAAQDLDRVDVFSSRGLNVYSILLRHKVILTLGAVQSLEERLCEDNRIITNQFS